MNQTLANYLKVEDAIIDAGGRCMVSVQEEVEERQDIFETWLLRGRLVVTWRAYWDGELRAFDVMRPVSDDNRMDTVIEWIKGGTA